MAPSSGAVGNGRWLGNHKGSRYLREGMELMSVAQILIDFGGSCFVLFCFGKKHWRSLAAGPRISNKPKGPEHYPPTQDSSSSHSLPHRGQTLFISLGLVFLHMTTHP